MMGKRTGVAFAGETRWLLLPIETPSDPIISRTDQGNGGPRSLTNSPNNNAWRTFYGFSASATVFRFYPPIGFTSSRGS